MGCTSSRSGSVHAGDEPHVPPSSASVPPPQPQSVPVTTAVVAAAPISAASVASSQSTAGGVSDPASKMATAPRISIVCTLLACVHPHTCTWNTCHCGVTWPAPAYALRATPCSRATPRALTHAEHADYSMYGHIKTLVCALPNAIALAHSAESAHCGLFTLRLLRQRPRII